MADLQRQGLIRHLGLSNVTSKQVEEGRRLASIVCVQNQYNLSHREDDAMVDVLSDAAIAFVPFFPLGGFTPLQSSTLDEVARSLNVTPMQRALAWLLQRSPNILLIPGTSSRDHLRENLCGDRKAAERRGGQARRDLIVWDGIDQLAPGADVQLAPGIRSSPPSHIPARSALSTLHRAASRRRDAASRLPRTRGVGMLASMMAAAALCVGVPDPVIDVHLHTYEQDARFDNRVPNPGTSAPMTVFTGVDHARATAAALKAAGVVRGIVGGASPATDDRLIALDPARLRGGYQIDDVPTAHQLAEIRARHAAGKLAMIGEVEYQYHGIAHDDPRLEPLWSLAEELQVPIAVHSGSGPAGIVFMGSPKHRERLGNPAAFEEVLVHHPRMKLIVMHAGWPWAEDMIALSHSYPQVYVDLGAIDWAEPRAQFDRYLETLVTYGMGDRILFGSDQMVWPEATAQAIDRVRSASYLSAAQKHAILFGNAARLFGWTDLQGCLAPGA